MTDTDTNIDAININITEKAALFLKKSLKNIPGAIGIRLSVTNSGCSGKSYNIEPVSKPNGLDLQFTTQNLSIFIDKQSYPTFRGLHIDLHVNGINESLKFTNPNAMHTCGCGNSFNDTY